MKQIIIIIFFPDFWLRNGCTNEDSLQRMICPFFCCRSRFLQVFRNHFLLELTASFYFQCRFYNFQIAALASCQNPSATTFIAYHFRISSLSVVKSSGGALLFLSGCFIHTFNSCLWRRRLLQHSVKSYAYHAKTEHSNNQFFMFTHNFTLCCFKLFFDKSSNHYPF